MTSHDTHPRDLDGEDTPRSIRDIGLSSLDRALNRPRMPQFLAERATEGKDIQRPIIRERPTVIEGGVARDVRPEDYAGKGQRRVDGAPGEFLAAPPPARPPMNPLSEEAAKIFSAAAVAGAKKLAADMLAQAKERTAEAASDEAATLDRGEFLVAEATRQAGDVRDEMNMRASLRTDECRAHEEAIARWGEWMVEEAEREARSIAEKHARDRSIAEKVAKVLDAHEAPLPTEPNNAEDQ